MYNHIDKNKYLELREELRKKTRGFKFDNEKKDSKPQTTFKIMRLQLNHFLDDYAVFLAHYEIFQGEGNQLESIHLAENVIKNFTSFWDYIGFYLNIAYELKFKFKDVYFKKAIGKINRTSKGTQLYKFSKKLENLYDDDGIRNYRHKSIHRSKLAYFRDEERKNNNKELLNDLKRKIEESYNRIIKALKIYFKMINECELIKEIKR